MTTKEKIAIMQAFEDGKEIEYRDNTKNDWLDAKSPLWDWIDYDYRIKPQKPQKPFIFEWLCSATEPTPTLFKAKWIGVDIDQKTICVYLPTRDCPLMPKKGKYKITIEEVTE